MHAEADAPFVLGHLLPAVGLGPEQVLLSTALALGAPKIAEIERGVQRSRLTVVVLTPAYMADRWAVFGEQIAGHLSTAEGRLIPLLRADCAVPLRLDFLVALDFRDPAYWADEAQRLRARLGQPVPREPKLPCPYPGMRTYSASTAPYFHGRDAEVEEIIGRLRAGERELYVIGPSGSGKSSLIAAGVVPRLTRGVSGLGAFVVRTLRPGEHPATRLGEVLEGDVETPAVVIATLLERSHPCASLLIFVDQLEELFVLARGDERARFLSALHALRAQPRCALVFTLRADFYGTFMESQLWDDLSGRISRIDIIPLRGAALRAAIEQPARSLGVFFEPELIERLLGDAASEPGILPLLQEALVQLWDRRRLQLLVLAEYQALGDGGRSGLAVAIARRADATLRGLTRTQEQIAHRILLRLVSFGEGRSDTRRQQAVSALRAVDDDPVVFDAVLRRLIEDRLVTIDSEAQQEEAHVDLAHEVMIDAWPTLAGWIRKRRVNEQRRRQLEAAARFWEQRGRGAGGLFDEIELSEAEAWLQTESARELGESAAVAALVTASRAAQDARRALDRIRRSRLIKSMAAAIAVLAAIGGMALWQARIAAHERDRADAHARFAETQHAAALQRADWLTLAQARAEVDLNPTRAIAMVKPLAEKYWPEVRSIAAAARAHGVAYGMPAAEATLSLEMSRDGMRALTGGSDGVARIYDLARRTWRALPTGVGGKARARFADEERRIVAWCDKTLAILDAASGAARTVTAPTSIAGLEVVGATAYWVDRQRTLWQFDLAAPAAAPAEVPLPEPVTRVMPSPDGRYLALTGSDHLLLLDRTRPDEPIEVTFGTTTSFDWSTDGKVFGALIDESAIVGSIEDAPHIVQRNHVGRRSDVVHAKDHGVDKIYVLGPTGVGTVSREDLPAPRKQVDGQPVGLREARGGAVIAGTSGRIVVLSWFGDRALPIPASKLALLDASPRSPYVVGAIDDQLLVWNLDDLEPRRIADQHSGPATQLLGAHAAIAPFADAGTQWIDLDTGKAQPLGEWPLLTAAASPSGQLACAIDIDGRARLVVLGREPAPINGHYEVAGFASEFELLLGSGADGTVHHYDPRSGKRTTLVHSSGKLLDLAWNRAAPPWAAARVAGGARWRKNLATGAEAIVADAATSGHLQVLRDGTVMFADGRAIRAWRPGGALERHAELPRPIALIGLAGPRHLLALLDDDSAWLVELAGPNRVEQTEPIITTREREGAPPIALSLAADTGTLVVPQGGGINVVDTVGRFTWTLAVQPPSPNLYESTRIAYNDPQISADGTRVIARLPEGLVTWVITVPTSGPETVKWVASLTNAAIDTDRPNKLIWH